jgi:hypothetical protein
VHVDVWHSAEQTGALTVTESCSSPHCAGSGASAGTTRIILLTASMQRHPSASNCQPQITPRPLGSQQTQAQLAGCSASCLVQCKLLCAVQAALCNLMMAGQSAGTSQDASTASCAEARATLAFLWCCNCLLACCVFDAAGPSLACFLLRRW